MYTISDYIGKKVRRISFLVKRADDGKYHHLFSIVEYLYPEMQDYEAFRVQKGEYIDFIKDADGDKDKVFFVVDFPVLAEDYLKNPVGNYTIGNDTVYPEGNVANASWRYDKPVIVPLHKDEKGSLAYLLPKRNTAAYVNVYQPEKTSAFESRILEQVKKLSERNLDRDLTLYPVYLGTAITVCYNPIYQALDLTEDANRDGVFIRINYREQRKEKLRFRFRLYLEDDTVAEPEAMWSQVGAFLSNFKLPHTFRKLDIDVYDESGRLVDYYDNVVFIHRINVDMQIKSREIHVQNEKGETMNVIEKYAGESFVVGNRKAGEKELKEAPVISYQKVEEALEYVFFDGDKERVAENERKAEATVMKMLNKASKVCYICDMYFSVKTLQRFVMPMKLESVEIRILSSKEELKADEIEKLRKGCKELRDKNISNVRCRLMRGEKAALHDRYIVADDMVWLVGCSLDEIGKRATNIARVPKDYCQKVLDRIEEWWNSDDLTEEIV